MWWLRSCCFVAACSQPDTHIHTHAAATLPLIALIALILELYIAEDARHSAVANLHSSEHLFRSVFHVDVDSGVSKTSTWKNRKREPIN